MLRRDNQSVKKILHAILLIGVEKRPLLLKDADTVECIWLSNAIESNARFHHIQHLHHSALFANSIDFVCIIVYTIIEVNRRRMMI